MDGVPKCRRCGWVELRAGWHGKILGNVTSVPFVDVSVACSGDFEVDRSYIRGIECEWGPRTIGRKGEDEDAVWSDGKQDQRCIAEHIGLWRGSALPSAEVDDRFVACGQRFRG